MKNLNILLSDIKSLKEKYDAVRNKNKFNVFRALHKEFDEVNLHSRFISYLLSPTSGHGMNKLFCELFVREILKIDESNFDLTKFIVLPNEKNKSEYKEIDILIINKKKKQAIIIENKINAKDSNKTPENSKGDGYDGQLERYYNTIKKGIDKDGNHIYDYKCETVFIFYLTMFQENQPSATSIGELRDVKVIYYGDEIRKWLLKCIEKVPLDKIILKETIKQYLNLIDKLTNNDIFIEERKELKTITAKNWKTTKYLIENFKHIKWHTVDDFWNQLKVALEKNYSNVKLFPDDFNNKVTEITHQNKDLNIGVLFENEGEKCYISSYGQLSWGVFEPKKWSHFKSDLIENIIFSTFSTENTFRLINNENIAEVVNLIIEEINIEVNNNYKNLTNF